MSIFYSFEVIGQNKYILFLFVPSTGVSKIKDKMAFNTPPPPPVYFSHVSHIGSQGRLPHTNCNL